MKIAHISDTHNLHRQIKKLPKADILVHSGDVSFGGTVEELMDFLDWFSALDYEHKVFIGGNHDYCLERASSKEVQKFLPKDCYYLNGNGITINNIRFWGVPFFVEDDISGEYYNLIKRIPKKVDVLITHRPPLGILDNAGNISFGCSELLDKITDIKPKIHLFGHTHDAYGMVEVENTRYYNGALVDEKYNLINEPLVIEI